MDTAKIKIEERLVPAGQNAGGAAFVFARSKTYEKLKEEIYKYMIRRTGGGSVLLSGHRGAGKTTLVQNVIQDLKSESIDKQYAIRPILVPLHGPDLLDVSRSADRMNKDNTPAAAPTTEEGAIPATTPAANIQLSKENIQIKNVLENLTISLYRALADEFYNAFERKVTAAGRLSELKELIGLLRLELDESPDIGTLREIWSKAGFLESGVLFDDASENQGVQEIVLLTTAAQAFRIVTGVLTDSEESTKASERETTYAREASILSKDVISAIVALFSGLAVGIGTYQIDSKFKLLYSGLAGLGTALFANISFKYSSTTTTKAQKSKQYKFIRNRDISSLNRELPNLINRIRNLGLAPVFVVDELDKVLEDPFEEFGTLINYLKKLVSDSSFFCFLTDRNYYDFIINLNSKNKYPKEYTYFTHRLYVNYAPNDLHVYLDDLFQLRQLGDETQKVDAILVEYLLLNKANSHTIDLTREIIKRSDSGFINTTGIRSKLSYRFPILIQLAIESIIEDEDLSERIEQDAYFSQLISDTLYYPVKCWWSGERMITTTRATLIKYIVDKADFSFNPAKLAELIDNEDWVELEKVMPVSMTDIEILYQKLNELMEMLCDYTILQASLRKSDKELRMNSKYNGQGIWTSILDVIPLQMPGVNGSSMALVTKDASNSNTFKWQYDYFARPLESIRFEIEAVIKKTVFIKDFDEYLRSITSGEIGINEMVVVQVINSSPDYFFLQQAVARLENFNENKIEYPDRISDMQVVQEYHDVIHHKGPLVARVLVLAKFLSRYLPPGSTKRWVPALSTIQFLLDVKFGDTPEKLHAILKLLPFENEEFEEAAIEPVATQKWKTVLAKLLKKEIFYDRSPEQVKKNWLEIWNQRLLKNFVDNTDYFEVTMDDLVCDVSNYSFAQMVTPEISKIKKRSWSVIALEASGNANGDRPFEQGFKPAPPVWIVLPALYKLGFTMKDLEGLRNSETEWGKALSQSSYSSLPDIGFIIVITNQPEYQSSIAESELQELRRPIILFELQTWRKNKDAINGLLHNLWKGGNTIPIIIGEFGATDDADALIKEIIDGLNGFRIFHPVQTDRIYRIIPPYVGEVKSEFRIIRRIFEIEFDVPTTSAS